MLLKNYKISHFRLFLYLTTFDHFQTSFDHLRLILSTFDHFLTNLKPHQKGNYSSNTLKVVYG